MHSKRLVIAGGRRQRDGRSQPAAILHHQTSNQPDDNNNNNNNRSQLAYTGNIKLHTQHLKNMRGNDTSKHKHTYILTYVPTHFTYIHIYNTMEGNECMNE
ncbi:unnamed protein product [Ceratitis capitata]|uniref:(Mediterranean fruit fly) hypothetical protein n=1 Tax=Ceratitis capitata TaxID=7213 RepID=A0A811U9V6_CERCA|nr:unnamed protein product [Ceratitis capitata]